MRVEVMGFRVICVGAREVGDERREWLVVTWKSIRRGCSERSYPRNGLPTQIYGDSSVVLGE